MNIVVTGAAGYIGSVISQRLLQDKHTVSGIDTRSVHAWPKIGFTERAFLDIRSPQIDECFNNITTWHGQIDAIIHTAALASVPESINNPTETFSVNVQGTINMLRMALAWEVPNFLNSSSAAVYGSQSSECIEDQECVPITPYGLSKEMGEQILGLETKINVVNFRYFNVAGAVAMPDGTWLGENRKDQESHILPLLTGLASGRVKDFTLYDVDSIRDYVHVRDVVSAHTKALSTGCTPETYNVCRGKHVRNGDLVDLVERVSGVKIKDKMKVQERPRIGDPKLLIGRCDRLKELLDWGGYATNLTAIVDSAWRIEQQRVS